MEFGNKEHVISSSFNRHMNVIELNELCTVDKCHNAVKVKYFLISSDT